MAFATLDTIEIYDKETKTIKLTFVDSNGSAIDITGYSVYFTVKPEFDTDVTDAAAIIDETFVTNDATAGTTMATIDNTESDLTPGKYIYDIKYSNSDDSLVKVLGVGRFHVGNVVRNA